MNTREATKKWVEGFNAISLSLIEKAFKNDINNWHELTTVSSGDNVYYDGEYVEVIDFNYDERLVTLKTDENVTVNISDIEVERDSWIPMWGTLWTFGSGVDETWARCNPNLVSECGFRIFEDEETRDIYIGVDGAGYNFYESHWIPLYKTRGLLWDDSKDS